jgi:hypothetical protein
MTDHKTDGLTPAQKNFLSRRIAAGEKLTADRAEHYVQAHNKAVAARLKVGSPRYFAAITEHADALGGADVRENPAEDAGKSRTRQPPKQAAAEQPTKPRFDGASSPMPKLHGGRDEFHTLRNKAASATGRYGKK